MTSGPYASLNALRAGQTIEVEGIPVRAAADPVVRHKGQLYVGERNTGGYLLTAKAINPGWLAVYDGRWASPDDLALFPFLANLRPTWVGDNHHMAGCTEVDSDDLRDHATSGTCHWGWVVPDENAYAYDLTACVAVDAILD